MTAKKSINTRELYRAGLLKMGECLRLSTHRSKYAHVALNLKVQHGRTHLDNDIQPVR